MKKYILSLMTLALGVLNVYAESISVEDIAIKPGETATADIVLNNTRTDIVAFQMDIVLPDNISINKSECKLSSRITDSDQTLTVGKLESGAIRLTSTSIALIPLSGTSGTLVTIGLSVSNDFAMGQVSIENIRLITSNSERIKVNDVSFIVNSLHQLIYVVDGEVYKTLAVAYGTPIIPEAEPTKEGYTFSGWSEIPETMPAHDVEVTGSFSINSYKLTYIVDGVEYKSLSVVYGTAITPEAAPTKEGHTFSGWSEIPETMPAHDVEVTGSFSINQYTVKFLDWDGTIISETMQDYSSAITVPANPVREGYTFTGWDTEVPSVVPAHDVTFTATYSINSYKLTYVVDGEVYKTETINYGTAIVPEPALTKEGYTFSGWSEIPATMPAHDVEITGSFSINSYTLTYLLNGEVYKKETVVYGTPLIPEPALQKEGYTFSGWSEIPATMPAHDVEVTGRFTINSYILTYKVDGEVYKTETINYGTAITPEPAPTKEGHTFSGWSEIPETMPAHDVEVTGSFTVNFYTITYMLDGEEYETLTAAYGTAITPEPAPTKEGYTFSGWSEIPETMPAHDVIVTGSFTINSYKLTYIVDGEVYKTETINYGTTIVPEPALTKEGYTFSGWSEIPETMPAHDVTVTGTFTINEYTLTYILDGEVYKTFTVAYGTPITPEARPIKVGYTFSGWSEIPETMPAKDVVVTGSFTINNYKLTYIVDGEVYKTEDVVYGTPLVPEPPLKKEGYTFSGWSAIPETMPAHDVEVTGSFTVNFYTITYMVDGEEYETYTAAYGTPITPEAEPTKEGYTFSGWSEIPETMPACDLVVKGSFIINQYLLTYVLDGEEYKSFEVDYNAVITPISAPVKKGMTFSGWEGIPETMPAHDVTVTGTYSWLEETIGNVIYQVTDTLNNYASVIGNEEIEGKTRILSSVEIGGYTYTVNRIGKDAFAGCGGLTKVFIPESVTSIDSYAFAGCSGLTDVFCYAENVPETNGTAFNSSPVASATLHVPEGSLDSYKATSPWNEFGNIVAITLEPEAIAEETTVNPAETATPGSTTTDEGVNTSLGSDDEVNVEEGSVTMHTPMTTEEVSQLVKSVGPSSSDFAESFKGIYFQLAAGKGKIELDIETLGNYLMSVMKGSRLIGNYAQNTRGTITIEYDIDLDTWFFAYPAVSTPSGIRRANAADADGALKVYSIRIIPEEIYDPDGIGATLNNKGQMINDIYDLNGRKLAEPQKGINIIRYSDGTSRKVLIK